MALQLALSDLNNKDLARLISIPSKTWDEINKRLRREKTLPLRKAELVALVKDKLSDDIREAFVRQILGLGKLSRDYDIPTQEVILALEKAVEDADWDADNINKFQAIKGDLIDILSSDAIHAVVKAVDLALDHQRIFRNAKIITDIRPIFNDDRNKFLGAVVHSILRLRYYEGESNSDITFVLSERDIRKLLSACEMALRKADEARNLLDTKCAIQSFSLDEEVEDEC